ncbi:APC5 protein, partial [Basidiobolus ranarum]
MTNTFLTSHKIAVLILIDEYTRNLSWDTEVNQSLVFFLMSEIQNAGHDKDKKTMMVNFYTQLENMVSQSGDSIRNILVARLEELETPNDLYDFFKDLQKLIRSEDPEVAEEFEELLLERDSVFGVFVRRAQLAFCKLPFDEVSNLY